MPESVIFQGVTLVLCWHHSVQIHAIFSACFLTTYTLLHAYALPDACSTVVAGINCATRVAKSCELCTITSLFLLINFRKTIYFARPPIPSTTHFSWDEAKYFHKIVPLNFWIILSLWYMHYDCMMVPSCEILVTESHFLMILVVLHI